MKLSLLSLMAVAAIAFIGAGCQKVTVLDQDAKPVGFAAVQVTQKGAEESALPSYTDFLGNVMLTENLSDPEAKEMIVVSKSGYETRRVMRTKGEMSITIRSTTPSKAGTTGKTTTTVTPAATTTTETPE